MSPNDPAQDGDGEVLACFLESRRNKLYGYIRRRVSDHHTAEDITQKTALGFVTRWRQQQPIPENERESMLFGIAHKKIVDYYREGHRRPVTLIEDEPVATPAASTAEDEALGRLGYHELIQSLSCLTRPQRQAVQLVWIEDLDHLTAADMMGITKSGLRKHLEAARKRLTQHLSKPNTGRNREATRENPR